MKKLICLGLALVGAMFVWTGCSREEKHTHDFGDWKILEKASCTEDGSRERKCDCGEVQTEVIAATGHEMTAGVCLTCGHINEMELLEYASMQLMDLKKLPDGTYAVSLHGRLPEGVTVLAIPGEFEGKKITAIAENGFAKCETLVALSLGEGITTISSRAFVECKALQAIALPESLTTIQDTAFIFCTALKELHIPANVTSIGTSILRYNELEKLTVDEKNTIYHSQSGCLIETAKKLMIAGASNFEIPDDGSVVAIAEGAMYGIRVLTEIRIPESVVTIGEQAFWGGHTVRDVYLHKGIQTIGEDAFGGSGLVEYQTVHFDGTLDELKQLGEFYQWYAGSKTQLMIHTTDANFHAACDLKFTNEFDPPPTCTEGGKHIYACFCGKTEKISVGPRGHDYENGACIHCGEEEKQ
ncbi:MAG: leucine-rich repeat domain-containing protein [Clostridia bacterium]|nr:leucine-rich repeat domain-containing protein [Clostridia bacterium]